MGDEKGGKEGTEVGSFRDCGEGGAMGGLAGLCAGVKNVLFRSSLLYRSSHPELHFIQPRPENSQARRPLSRVGFLFPPVIITTPLSLCSSSTREAPQFSRSIRVLIPCPQTSRIQIQTEHVIIGSASRSCSPRLYSIHDSLC